MELSDAEKLIIIDLLGQLDVKVKDAGVILAIIEKLRYKEEEAK